MHALRVCVIWQGGVRCARSSARANAAACLPPASAAERRFWLYAGRYRLVEPHFGIGTHFHLSQNRNDHTQTKPSSIGVQRHMQCVFLCDSINCSCWKLGPQVAVSASLAASSGCDPMVMLCRKKMNSHGCLSQLSAGSAPE